MDLVVTKLSPVVIACTASGVPEPSIHWSKDGIKLPQEGQGYSILPTGQPFTYFGNHHILFYLVFKWNTFLLCDLLGNIIHANTFTICNLYICY